MSPQLTLITLTCDQPFGFALCEAYMARQTVPIADVQWLVIDAGDEPITPTRGQQYIRRPRAPGEDGTVNFCRNLLAAVPLVTGSHIAFVEHDDWYGPTYLERRLAQFAAQPGAMLAGDDDQRYYHLGSRVWRTFQNVGACLCQTMIRRELLGQFEQIVHTCLARNSYGVDTTFWRSRPRATWAIARQQTVVGLKGLPGRHGLGVGHRPDEKWTPDPTHVQLRAWIGDDAERYAHLGLETLSA